MDKFFELPLLVQLALGGGYAAYMVAYVGIRSHHKPIDVAFLSVMFGLIAVGTYHALPGWMSIGMCIVLAIAAALFGGIVWRLMSDVVRGWLRSTDYSWSNDDPSAWASFKRNSTHHLTQLNVQLDDGTWIFCDDLAAFENAPFGPCCLGDNGDVAMYATQRKLADGTIKEQPTVRDAGWGDRITYVPAARVKTIEFRAKAGA